MKSEKFPPSIECEGERWHEKNTKKQLTICSHQRSAPEFPRPRMIIYEELPRREGVRADQLLVESGWAGSCVSAEILSALSMVLLSFSAKETEPGAHQHCQCNIARQSRSAFCVSGVKSMFCMFRFASVPCSSGRT